MPNRETAQVLREHAERLCQIASLETKVSPELMRMAREIDAEAAKLEAAIPKAR